jgi:CheY-like chemotaxis protein
MVRTDSAESRWPSVSLDILVCDDDADAAAMLVDLLQILGQRTAMFTDPRDAVRAVGDYRPDIAILDIRMPHMDGFACAAAMRSISPRTVYVACTGWADIQARWGHDSAFSHHLVKPVGLEALIGVIDEVAAAHAR